MATWKEKYNKKYQYKKNKSHNLSDISKDTGVSRSGLQKIYNKGIGAYKTNPQSVRPTVTSKEQWAMARVYSSVMGGKASKVDAKELKMEMGGILNNPNFKEWFGDSKVVDENGNPLVVYHGTGGDFEVFNKEYQNEATGFGDFGKGFYLSSIYDVSRYYTNGKDNSYIMSVYLKVENPFVFDLISEKLDDNTKERLLSLNVDIPTKDIIQDLVNKNDFFAYRELGKTISDETLSQIFIDNGYDGVFINRSFITNDGTGDKLEKRNLYEIVVYEPNQIKSATDNDGEYSLTNDNITMEMGGHTDKSEITKVILTDFDKKRYFGQYKKVFDAFNEGSLGFSDGAYELDSSGQIDSDGNYILHVSEVLSGDVEERLSKIKGISFEEFYVDKELKMEMGGKASKINKKELNMEKGGSTDFNPDGNIKDKVVHASGDAGGMLVGKRHSNGGIKALNKSTGQPLEMEGGEVVITRNAVSDNKKRSFNGKMLTNRQILSEINESGGGVSFADGGKVPNDVKFDCNAEYEYGGKTMCGKDLAYALGGDVYAKGGKVEDDEWKSIVSKFLNEFYGDYEDDTWEDYVDSDSVESIQTKYKKTSSRYDREVSFEEAYQTFKSSLTPKELKSIEVSFDEGEYADAEEHDEDKNWNSITIRKVGTYAKGGLIPNVGTVDDFMLKELLMKNKKVLAILSDKEIAFMKLDNVDVIGVSGKNYDFIFTDGKKEFEIINQDRKLKHSLRDARPKIVEFYSKRYAKGGTIECGSCDWSWDEKDGGDDMYVCHKCGTDNTNEYKNGGITIKNNNMKKNNLIKPKRKGKNIMTLAKEIRKKDESWQDALKRAKIEMNKTSSKKSSNIDSELGKLKELIKEDEILKEYNYSKKNTKKSNTRLQKGGDVMSLGIANADAVYNKGGEIDDKLFDKIYKKYRAKNYFDLDDVIKNKTEELKRFKKKGDKNALKYNEDDVKNYLEEENYKRNYEYTYKPIVNAIKNNDKELLKNRVRYNQKFSKEIFETYIGNKLPNSNVAISKYFDENYAKGGKLSKDDAITKALKLGVDFNKDFHSQSFGNELSELAKETGYRKSKSSSGSLGRSFFNHLQKIYDKNSSYYDSTLNSRGYAKGGEIETKREFVEVVNQVKEENEALPNDFVNVMDSINAILQDRGYEEDDEYTYDVRQEILDRYEEKVLDKQGLRFAKGGRVAYNYENIKSGKVKPIHKLDDELIKKAKDKDDFHKMRIDYYAKNGRPNLYAKGGKTQGGKFADGGTIGEYPRVYIADLEAYNNGELKGEWLDLADYNDSEEFNDAVQDLLDGWGVEEYAIHDVENFPDGMYSEYMGTSDFDEIYDMIELAKNNDLPLDVVMEVVSQYDESAVEEYQGQYEDGEDFASQMIDEIGLENFSDPQYFVDISDMDRRIMAQEMADSYTDDIAYEDDGERVVEEAGLDVDEYRELDGEDDDKRDEILEEAKEIVRDEYYETWYDGLDDPYDFLVNEQGIYSDEDFFKANFIQIDYGELANALEQDYLFIENDKGLFVFNVR